MSELPPDESSTGGADAATPKAVGHEARGAKTFPLTLAPAAAPTAANDNFVDRTIALWRHRMGREVSREEARQIAENVTGFFPSSTTGLVARLAPPRMTTNSLRLMRRSPMTAESAAIIAVSRNADGSASGVIGAVLDKIVEGRS
jgi:hypothetical protein